DDDDEKKKETTNVNSPGTGGEQSTLTSDVTTNLGTVEENMLPGSLAISTAGLRLQEGDDPCAESDGFFDCQPEMLKLYMDLARTMVGGTSDIVAEFSEGFFSDFPVPTDGEAVCETLTIDDDESLDSVEYCVTSESEYAIKINTNLGP